MNLDALSTYFGHNIDVRPMTRQTVAALEVAEARTWTDLYAAAPADWAAGVGLGSRRFGDTVALHWAATGRRYFSRAIGLGVTNPATEEQLDAILAFWAELGVDMFLLQSMPECEPADYGNWLSERGLGAFDAQDRVVRGGEPHVAGTVAARSRDVKVEAVTSESAVEWSDFLQAVYRLDAGPWLPHLIGRPGWHQYIAREAGEIVAARGMHIGLDGIAWLGMDGPVPGVMTEDYEPDAALCDFIVGDGLRRGAHTFIADIELPSANLDTPAYEYFGRLGFVRPYVRTHHARVS
jgi:hypothetical protein